jgi:hypothetical protein
VGSRDLKAITSPHRRLPVKALLFALNGSCTRPSLATGSPPVSETKGCNNTCTVCTGSPLCLLRGQGGLKATQWPFQHTPAAAWERPAIRGLCMCERPAIRGKRLHAAITINHTTAHQWAATTPAGPAQAADCVCWQRLVNLYKPSHPHQYTQTDACESAAAWRRLEQHHSQQYAKGPSLGNGESICRACTGSCLCVLRGTGVCHHQTGRVSVT